MDGKHERRSLKKTHKTLLGLETAEKILSAIDSLINRRVLVGSLGRAENYIGDIDILVEPSEGESTIPAIREVLEGLGEWNRGATRQMVVDNVLDSGIGLDLYICHPPAQWGVLTACRLNPNPLVIYGKAVLDSMGYRRKGGALYLTNEGPEIPIPDEETWFNLVGIPFVPPDLRWELTRDLRLI